MARTVPVAVGAVPTGVAVSWGRWVAVADGDGLAAAVVVAATLGRVDGGADALAEALADAPAGVMVPRGRRVEVAVAGGRDGLGDAVPVTTCRTGPAPAGPG